MKTALCSCNNCGIILIDTNPQVDAPLYDVEVGQYKELEVMEEDGEYFKGCPECGTDSYLNDDPNFELNTKTI